MTERTLQPNSKDCFVCGIFNQDGLKLRFYSNGSRRVEAEYIVPEQFQGYPGVVHGGIVAAMLDEITYRSLITDDPKRMMFSARLDIRYRGNVPVGEKLRLVGEAVKVKSRTATATGKIIGPDGDVLAEAEALLINVPDGMVQDSNLEELGWRVYTDEEFKSKSLTE